jgi:hypothetical protein
MSLTVWAGAPGSFIRLYGDGAGRWERLPRFFSSKKKGSVQNLTLLFFAEK